jgi:hypothetical protein
MVLDVRAKIICNLGPVISGSVKDDHVQGQGLVMTTGELVIAGLITPAHGDPVKLAYITPDDSKAARFPRGPFYVTKAFADPLRNQTQVSIADKLAFEKAKGGGTVNSALVDGLNGRLPKVAKALDLYEAFTVITDRIGLDVATAGTWTLPKQVPALDSDDYVETLSDILASVTRFGFLNPQGELVAQSYKDLATGGPVLGFDQVVDLNGNQGGLDFTENPTGSGTAQAVDGDDEDAPTTEWLAGSTVVDAEYGSFTASWDQSETSTQTSIKVTLRNGTTRSYPITETVQTFERKAEPDNRVLERTAVTSTSLVKVNSQVIQDYLNAGTTGPSAATAITTRKSDLYTYQEIPPPALSEQEEEQVEQEILAAQQAIAAAHPSTDHPVMTSAGTIVLLPKLPTYRVIREESSETMSYMEALGRIGVRDYTKMASIPSGEGIKQSIITDILYSATKQKRIERTYVAYGLTQMGQQAISAAAVRAALDSSLSPFIDQFFRLVLEDVKVVTSDLNVVDEDKPVPDYLAPYQAAEAVIQGGSRIQVGATPEVRSNKAISFSVPFLPDDVVNDDGSVTKGNAETAAANYAEEQNRLLLGHRLGLQVTTGLGVLPSQPLGAFHLRKGGFTATYRTNGTAWSFDANSCLVSTDALYWGLAGGDISGPRWTPVAPGTSALPTPPADVDNGPQDPVNSVTLVSEFEDYAPITQSAGSSNGYGLITEVAETLLDYGSVTALSVPSVSDSVAIAELIDSLPDDQSEVFEAELAPVALALPYKPISTAALQVRLQLETLLVPLGINRSMGDAALQVTLQAEAVQAISEQVVLELESGEGLVVGFAAGFGLGGNLS